MKTYQIEFYMNTKCILVLNNVAFDFEEYSKEDLINDLWVYGYVDMRDEKYLIDHTNSWVIEEETK